MKALPFMESIGNLNNNEEFFVKVAGLYQLFRQRFRVDLLINPEGRKPEPPEEPYLSDPDCDVHIQWQIYLKQWQEAEDKLLFEGFKKKLRSVPYGWSISFDENKSIRSYFDGKYIISTPDKEWTTMLPETVNEFISDFRRAGIELIWKESVINNYFS